MRNYIIEDHDNYIRHELPKNLPIPRVGEAISVKSDVMVVTHVMYHVLEDNDYSITILASLDK